MSLSDTPAYCEESDVQAALQETQAAFDDTPLGTTNVEAAIFGASRWFARRSSAHFYDSTAAASDLISDSPRSATGIVMSIPSSPHPQPGTIRRVSEGIDRQPQYPKTQRGFYARAKHQSGGAGLPYRYVESIDALRVAELGGEQDDWVADPDKTEGRGEDYYLDVDGGDGYGASYLFVQASSLGPRRSLDGVLDVDVSYGLDWQDTPWADVRRGVGHLAAAELVVDDDVLTRIPENGGITNVDTQAQQHLDAAMDRYLGGYLEVRIA
jgi:hypothetical protein